MSNRSDRWAGDEEGDVDEYRDAHADRRDKKYNQRRGGTWGVHGRAYIRSVTDAVVKRARKAEDDGRRE